MDLCRAWNLEIPQLKVIRSHSLLLNETTTTQSEAMSYIVKNSNLLFTLFNTNDDCVDVTFKGDLNS